MLRAIRNAALVLIKCGSIIRYSFNANCNIPITFSPSSSIHVP